MAEPGTGGDTTAGDGSATGNGTSLDGGSGGGDGLVPTGSASGGDADGGSVGCVSDEDCLEPTPVCDVGTGLCVACLSNDDCADPTPICDPELVACVSVDWPGNECVTSDDCPPSLGCAGGYCLRCQGNGDYCLACTTEDDCGSGFEVCNEVLSACVECTSDGPGSPCEEGEICHPYGECDPLCVDDGDCPQNRECDEFGRCVPPTAGTDCAVDDDCPGDMQCVSDLCRECVPDPADPSLCLTCQPGSTCDDGSLCDYDVFVCVECRGDDDCGGGDLCHFGACGLPCDAENPCPALSECDLGSNHCQMP